MNQHHVHIYKIYNNKMHLPTLGMCMHFPKLTVIHKLTCLCICQCACVFLMCLLTGVGAVVFGPVHTSILAHLEIEALSAEQPGHYALQLWFYMQTRRRRRRRVTEKKWRVLYITEPLNMNEQKLVSSVSFKRMIYK